MLFIIHQRLHDLQRNYCTSNMIVYYLMKDSMMCMHLNTYNSLLQNLVGNNISHFSELLQLTIQGVSAKLI